MKKIYLLLVAALFSFSTACSTAWAQQVQPSSSSRGTKYEDYTWTPLKGNFVATDYKGVQHDIEAYLAEGKCVLIDLSATYCLPCWNIHQGGYLEKYHNLFGPNGTKMQRLVVLWVEVTGAPWAKITDPNRNWAKQHNSAEDVSYAILSEKFMARSLGLPVAYVPSIYMLSPKKEYTEILDSGILYSEERMQDLINACPEVPRPPMEVQANAIDVAYTGEEITWTPSYRSGSPITAFQWEFEGANKSTSSEETASVTWSTPGTYKVKLTLTNAQGATTVERDYTVLDANKITYPILVDAEDGLFPMGWRTWEEDKDQKNWTNIKTDFDRLSLELPESYEGGYNSRLCLVSWSFFPTSGSLSSNGGFNLKGENVEAKNWLVSPPITIPDNAESASISFATGKYFTSAPDKYKLLAATQSFQPTYFTHELKAGEVASANGWKEETIDLMSFKGKTITLAFVHERKGTTSSSTPGSGFLLDDIKIEVKVKTPLLETLAGVEVAVYPTETSDYVTIDLPEGSEIRVFDLMGKLCYKATASASLHTIDVAAWAEGRYFVQVLTEGRARASHSFFVDR